MKYLLAGPDIKNSNIELPLQTIISGFSNPQLPIVTNQGITIAQWGLIPSWTLNQAQANDLKTKTLNAVGETVFEKKSFKESILSKRCILPINGFLDWRHLGKEKYPYLVKATSNPIFSLGCIYDFWKNDLDWCDNSILQHHHNSSKSFDGKNSQHKKKNAAYFKSRGREKLD